ncbi:MAG: hypothetical protein CME62_13660 [Halobacteriovoraceae bacterium]|nr:hypothetical protein [Halobacteriovoraceae bacterium]
MRTEKMKNNLIQKRSKNEEPFDFSKYRKSLRKSGVTKHQANNLVEELGDIKKYFSTAELNYKTYKLLLRKSKVLAANYNLKQAIYSLGPTGYPFEILCAELLKVKGYTTRVSVIKKGKWVKHEVDLIAKRDDGCIYGECKFHNKKNIKNDIKVPLYVHARFLDIKEGNPREEFQPALFTNTFFSKDAIKYARGVNLSLYAMNYPRKNNFIDLIQKYKVYPITSLHSLKKSSQQRLLDQGIVVIKQLNRKNLLPVCRNENELVKVLQEVKILTRPN